MWKNVFLYFRVLEMCSKWFLLFCHLASAGSLNDFFQENTLHKESIRYFLGGIPRVPQDLINDVPNGEVSQGAGLSIGEV